MSRKLARIDFELRRAEELIVKEMSFFFNGVSRTGKMDTRNGYLNESINSEVVRKVLIQTLVKLCVEFDLREIEFRS